MHLVIFGANGSTGRLLTRQALGGGHTVSAVTRHPEVFPITHERLRVVSADVRDPASVEGAVAGAEAVLSTLGVPFSRRPITLYSEGTTHIIDAMRTHGVRRLVCVSSSATDPGGAPTGGFVVDKVLQPFFIGVVGRTLYADLRRMEQLVTESELDWTIVRPSGLFDTPEVTKFVTGEGHLDSRFTSRADLARCMLDQAADRHDIGKKLAVVTVDVKPSLLKLLWREGISKSLHRTAPAATAPPAAAA